MNSGVVVGEGPSSETDTAEVLRSSNNERFLLVSRSRPQYGECRKAKARISNVSGDEKTGSEHLQLLRPLGPRTWVRRCRIYPPPTRGL